jgi:integrase
MGKRGSGEGSIYQDSRGWWTAAISLGYKNGRRVRKVIRRATRAEVAEELTKKLREQQLGAPIPHERRTLGDFLRVWIVGVKTTVRPKTYRSYEQIVRNHLAPSMFPPQKRKKHAMKKPREFQDFGIAKLQLSKLTVSNLDRFFRAKLESGCSPALVRYVRVVLRIALNDALKRDLVARNVAEFSKPPRAAKTETVPLDFEQAKRFLAAIAGHRFEALFLVGLVTGLRHGEILALQIEDYDRNMGVLKVFHTLQRNEGRIELLETKSVKGKRIIPLPDLCAAAIETHLRRRKEMREWAGARWRETGYLFCSTIGTPLFERNVLRDLRSVLKLAGLPKLRMHDLRHSCVTLLGALGVPPRTIADLVGHSDIRLTQNVYQHAFMGMKREAVEGFAGELQKPAATLVATPKAESKPN